MSMYDLTDFDGHEQVSFFNDKESGLKAIVAVHDTTLGPSLGGCRMFNYCNEQEALVDVLRLSRGMSYKSALAGLKLGGGKSVIIGDPRTEKTQEKLASFGKFLNRLGGTYIAAEDSGTSVEDLKAIGAHTNYVSGVKDKQTADGGSKSGDPSPATAYGVFLGIKASVKAKTGRHSLDGLTVGIQGLGHVGLHLAKYLADEGVNLLVSDIDETKLTQAAKEWGAKIVKGEAIFESELDVFAPCAMGAIINERTIDMLKTQIIAGAANNQLSVPEIGEELNRRGILYAPDFAINAGGIIDVYHEQIGYDATAVSKHVNGIYDTLIEIFERSKLTNTPTSQIADELARERIAAAKK